MMNEGFRQITKTALKESSETRLEDHESDFSKECINPEEGDREWKTPCSSVDGCARGSGYHTPAYLSPGITQKLQLNEDMELPFLAARS